VAFVAVTIPHVQTVLAFLSAVLRSIAVGSADLPALGVHEIVWVSGAAMHEWIAVICATVTTALVSIALGFRMANRCLIGAANVGCHGSRAFGTATEYGVAQESEMVAVSAGVTTAVVLTAMVFPSALRSWIAVQSALSRKRHVAVTAPAFGADLRQETPAASAMEMVPVAWTALG
jgi:hypothetical protein